MRVKFVDLDGIRTRVVHEGDSYPLLLIHGYGGIAEHWWHNIDELGKDFNVYAPDLIGHGFTDRVPFNGEAPHPRFVDHLARLVDHLKLEHFAVCGSSFGSLLSCLLYLRMPERVDKLILCGSGSTFNSDSELAAALPQAKANTLRALDDPTLASCLKRLGNTSFDESTSPPATALVQLISYAMPGRKEAYIEGMHGMMDQELSRPYRVLHRLGDIKLPTLVIWGRQDPRGLYESAVRHVPEMPNARLIAFDECGHKPFMEKPDQFHEAVRSFLSAERKRPA
jgi:2-hydroxy-6-oxonona-2,4-dienedioate hydrolase